MAVILLYLPIYAVLWLHRLCTQSTIVSTVLKLPPGAPSPGRDYRCMPHPRHCHLWYGSILVTRPCPGRRHKKVLPTTPSASRRDDS